MSETRQRLVIGNFQDHYSWILTVFYWIISYTKAQTNWNFFFVFLILEAIILCGWFHLCVSHLINSIVYSIASLQIMQVTIQEFSQKSCTNWICIRKLLFFVICVRYIKIIVLSCFIKIITFDVKKSKKNKNIQKLCYNL